MIEKKVKALEIAESEYLMSRVEALEKVPSNPYLAATYSDDKQKYFLVGASASPMNNRICGVDIDNPAIPKKVLTKFQKAGAPICIPVIGKPAEVKEKARIIGAEPLRGWSQGQFSSALHKLPISPLTQQTRRLKPSDMADFVQIHSKEFRTPSTNRDMVIDMFKGLVKTKRAEAYAVDIDGLPVAIGLLYFAKNKIAYLATAATSKAARKQGAHSALIACRIEAARKRGSKQIFSTALLNSQSRRNLEKAGLSLSHVQTIITI